MPEMTADEERRNWEDRKAPYDTAEGRVAAPFWLRTEMTLRVHKNAPAAAVHRDAPAAAVYGNMPAAANAGGIAASRPAPRYSAGKRATYGLFWAAWTVLLIAGSVGTIATGHVGPGLIGLVLTALAGWYDYRIWTYQAKHLVFFIIF